MQMPNMLRAIHKSRSQAFVSILAKRPVSKELDLLALYSSVSSCSLSFSASFKSITNDLFCLHYIFLLKTIFWVEFIKLCSFWFCSYIWSLSIILWFILDGESSFNILTLSIRFLSLLIIIWFFLSSRNGVGAFS